MSIFELTLFYAMVVVFCIVSSFCLATLRHLFQYTHKLSQRLETLEKKESDCVAEFFEPAEWFDNEGEDR